MSPVLHRCVLTWQTLSKSGGKAATLAQLVGSHCRHPCSPMTSWQTVACQEAAERVLAWLPSLCGNICALRGGVEDGFRAADLAWGSQTRQLSHALTSYSHRHHGPSTAVSRFPCQGVEIQRIITSGTKAMLPCTVHIFEKKTSDEICKARTVVRFFRCLALNNEHPTRT